MHQSITEMMFQMKILSTIVILLAIQVTSTLSFRGRDYSRFKNFHESPWRHLTGNNVRGGGGIGANDGVMGMGMMVRT